MVSKSTKFDKKYLNVKEISANLLSKICFLIRYHEQRLSSDAHPSSECHKENRYDRTDLDNVGLGVGSKQRQEGAKCQWIRQY